MLSAERSALLGRGSLTRQVSSQIALHQESDTTSIAQDVLLRGALAPAGRHHLLTCHQQDLAGIGPLTDVAGVVHARSGWVRGNRREGHTLASDQGSKAKEAAWGAAAAG